MEACTRHRLESCRSAQTIEIEEVEIEEVFDPCLMTGLLLTAAELEQGSLTS